MFKNFAALDILLVFVTDSILISVILDVNGKVTLI